MKNSMTILLFLTVTLFAADWNLDIMPLSQIKPGMRGITKTVFYGQNIEELQVEILEIIEDMYPTFDIILARLHGEKAELNGVVSGMSGSPVYINGKLVGALAYRLGEFPKEPITGIMPIEHMLKIIDKESVRDIELAAAQTLAPDYLQAVLCGFKNDFWSSMLAETSRSFLWRSSVQPISSPLVFSGIQPNIIAPYKQAFEQMGFTVAAGGSSSEEKTDISAGSAVAVMLISGDAGISATGTVTAVDGDQLLAFGHPVFNHGAISLPLAGAKILWTIPSLMGSTKMSATTDIAGTFIQDRISGALGDLSKKPYTVPVHLKMNSPFDGSSEFNFQMAFDPTMNNLLPHYLRIALVQAMYTGRLSGGNHTAHLTGAIVFEDGQTIDFDDIYSSEQRFGYSADAVDFNNAGDIVTAAMGAAMVNDFQAPRIKNVELQVKGIAGKNIYSIRNVQQNKAKVKPGESVELLITLQDEDENVKLIRHEIKLPQTLQGRNATVFISNGSALTQYEVQANRDSYVPRSFDHLIEIVNKRRKPQNIYIQVRTADRGLTLSGKNLNDLPPSIISTMNSRASVGESAASMERIVYEACIPTQKMISGAKRISLQLRQPEQAFKPNNNGH